MMSIPCIGYASGVGAGNPGCALAPYFLKDHLDIDGLLWETIVSPGKLPPLHLDKFNIIAKLSEQLAQASCTLTRNTDFFFSFGGDHSAAIGTWSGVAKGLDNQDLGLIWVDAHMDAHTSKTSPSGNIHGMPLATLLGYGDKRLTDILLEEPKIKKENVFIIGARSFEEGEEKLLRDLGVQIFHIDEVHKRGLQSILQEVISIFYLKNIPYGISFDIDSIDPEIINATGTPVPNGIKPEDAIDAFKALRYYPPIAFELVEYNHLIDDSKETFAFIKSLLEQVIKEVNCIFSSA